MAKVTRIYRSFSFERSFFSVRKHKTEKCPALKRYEQRFVRGLKITSGEMSGRKIVLEFGR